jgi:hypothetical protein
MKKQVDRKIKSRVYKAPVLYPGIFYLLLAAWSFVCVYLLGTKAINTGWPLGQLLMIAFVLAYTWYFSLGISYKIAVEPDGKIELTSFRRTLKIHAENIDMVEGPRFAMVPFGFMRFRLEREKAYLFIIITDQSLEKVIRTIRRANPKMKCKGLYAG